MSGIYIHIPFCHSKCAYCDFYSLPVRKDEQALVDCIIQEFKMRRNEIDNITTVYLGGGTPSLLEDNVLEKLFEEIQVSDENEVTLEVNPEDVSKERVERWKSMGINRISMGVQSFADNELKIIGRRHSGAEAKRAIENIREGGIDNFSIDLIYGLPEQSIESWRHSLETLYEFSPYHFSAYMLTYEPRTRLSALLKSGKITAIDEDSAVAMYMALIETARLTGYEHYEISNFAKPGFQSKHNSNYWNDTPYLGLGPGAHSFDGKMRRVNAPDIKGYIKMIKGGSSFFDIEEESPSDTFNNLIITALRTKGGLDFKRVKRSRRRQFLCDAFPYLRSQELMVTDNHFYIPEIHWLISDSIMRDLMQ